MMLPAILANVWGGRRSASWFRRRSIHLECVGTEIPKHADGRSYRKRPTKVAVTRAVDVDFHSIEKVTRRAASLLLCVRRHVKRGASPSPHPTAHNAGLDGRSRFLLVLIRTEVDWGVSIMARAGAANFTCPNCSALDHIVKAEAGPETTTDGDIACRICGGPLPARDEQFVLKYFSYEKRSKTRNGSASLFPRRLSSVPSGAC
jgi:hypothetical protein